MAANLRNGPPVERRTPMSELGGTLAIAFSLRRGRAFQFSARRRAAWMILDLRRSRAGAKLHAALPHGLPFAMGLSPLLAAWSRAARLGSVVGAPVAAERLPNRTLQPRSLQIGLGPRSVGLPWILGFAFAHRVGSVATAVPAPTPRAAGVIGAPPELAVAAPRSSDQGEQAPAMHARVEPALPALDVGRPGQMQTGRDPTLLARSRSAEAAPTSSDTLAPVWATVHRREIPWATSAPAEDRLPHPPARERGIAASLAEPATAPRRSGIARGEPAAASANANVNPIQQSEADSVSGTPRQTGLPWFSPAAAAATSSALAAAAKAAGGRDLPSEDFAHRQRPAASAVLNESIAMTMPAPALSMLADPLQQLVSREVSKQIAAAVRMEPLVPSPSRSPSPRTAARAPAPDSDLPSDDFARRLLSKMRAISREERFRGGYLR
jgi:hypothetical protein